MVLYPRLQLIPDYITVFAPLATWDPTKHLVWAHVFISLQGWEQFVCPLVAALRIEVIVVDEVLAMKAAHDVLKPEARGTASSSTTAAVADMDDMRYGGVGRQEISGAERLVAGEDIKHPGGETAQKP